MAELHVHGWHTECGSCGYGSGGWASSPALQGKPVLGPEDVGECCPGCDEEFTARLNYSHNTELGAWGETY